MNRKIVSMDFDNTYYNKEKVNNEYIKNNNDAIKNYMDKNNILIVNTARSFLSLKKKLEECNLEFISANYYACNMGSIIIDKNYNIINSINFCKNILEALIEKSNELFNEEFILKNSENIDGYGNIVNSISYDDKEISNVNFIQISNFDEEKLKTFNEIIMNDDILKNKIEYNTLRDNIYIRMSSSKFLAHEYIRNLEKISENNSYAIGDDINDISLFENMTSFLVDSNSNDIKEEIINYHVENVSDAIKIILEKE